LAGQVAGHGIDVVGKVFPGPGNVRHDRLAAELTFGAHLTRHARHFRGEAVQLVDHRIDGLLQLQDLAAHVDRDLARQVTARDGRGHLGDVAHLAGQVAGHGIDLVGQVLPHAAHVLDVGLAAELAFRAHLARHARHFGGEGIELVHHRVDGFFQLQDLAAHVDRDLARQVAARDGRRHLGDVAYLAGQVAGHGVDVVGEVLPDAADTADLCLAAELALGTNLARHACHLGGEGIELVDHGVDRLFQLQNLALDVGRDLARQIAVGNGGSNFGDVAHLAGEVPGHGIDAVGQVLPGTGHARHHGLAAQPALGADLARHARHLGGERAQLIDHGIDGLLQLQDLAAYVDRDLARQVAAGDGGGDLGDVAHLAGEITGHRVDVVRQVLPGAGHARHDGLATELALGADLARHARHFRGKTIELVDHRIDGVLELEDLALHVDGDLA